MFDACERVVPPRAAAVPTTPGSFLWCEQSLNLINVIFWNVIHISLIRVLPPSSFTRAFSLATTPLERRNSYQFNKGLARPRLLVLSRYQPTPREKRNSYQCNKRTVPHPRLLVLSPYPPPPPLQRKRNSYQFNKGIIPLAVYPCFFPTHHPPGKNVVHIGFNNKGTIPLPFICAFSLSFHLTHEP